LIPPKFIPYCESRGIKLLKDDIRFIEKQLLKYPCELHRSILSDYLFEFELGSGFDENESLALRMNRGRFRANTWLMHFDRDL